MSYAVKEIFYTLQGEGAQAGRPRVLPLRRLQPMVRSGKGPGLRGLPFCDTDFVGTDGTGGGRSTMPTALAAASRALAWGGRRRRPWSSAPAGNRCCNSIAALIEALHAADSRSRSRPTAPPVPGGIDWVCVSPKAGSELVFRTRRRTEARLPPGGAEAQPENYLDLRFDNFFLQPMDGPDRVETLKATIEYCLANPTWRLSLQTHKIMGIP